jgi:predicted MFS family arabinose efflux permease
VLGLLRGNEEGWGSTMILSLFAGAAALMIAFLAIESRVKEPMLPLRLFRKPAFTGVQLAALGVSASMFALFLYITFYLQNYLGHSPLEAGLIYLPFTVVTFFVAAAGGALLARVPARVIMSVGLLMTGIGLLLMGGLNPADEWTALLGGFLIAGAGTGLLNPVIADVALSVVPKEQSGMAAGINDTFRQVGIAVGIAAWGAIFLGRGTEKVEQLAAGTPAATGERPRQLVEAVSSGNLDTALASVPPGSRQGVSDAARDGFLSGLNEIFMLGGILAFAAALFALWLVRERDIEREPVDLEASPEVKRELELEAA